jgi:hypothetical protein
VGRSAAFPKGKTKYCNAILSTGIPALLLHIVIILAQLPRALKALCPPVRCAMSSAPSKPGILTDGRVMPSSARRYRIGAVVNLGRGSSIITTDVSFFSARLSRCV